MVHFAIAAKLSSSNPSPNILLGSIAPDAVHMRDNVTREDKGKTHLVSDKKLPSVEIIKRNCFIYLSKNNQKDWKDFVLGYFAHLYTDLRWTETVYVDFESNYRGDKQEIRQIYNNEMSKLEFILLRSEDWAHKFIHTLQQSEAFTIEPFVTETEVSQYRDLKLAWLQDANNEPKIKPYYFTEKIVRDFINHTANEWNTLFNDWEVEFLREGRNIS